MLSKSEKGGKFSFPIKSFPCLNIWGQISYNNCTGGNPPLTLKKADFCQLMENHNAC